MKPLDTQTDPAAEVEEERETVDVWLPDAPTPREILPSAETETPLLDFEAPGDEPAADLPSRLDLPGFGEPASSEVVTVPDIAGPDGCGSDAVTVLDVAGFDEPSSEVATLPDVSGVDGSASDASTALDLSTIEEPSSAAKTLVDLAILEVQAKASTRLELPDEQDGVVGARASAFSAEDGTSEVASTSASETRDREAAAAPAAWAEQIPERRLAASDETEERDPGFDEIEARDSAATVSNETEDRDPVPTDSDETEDRDLAVTDSPETEERDPAAAGFEETREREAPMGSKVRAPPEFSRTDDLELDATGLLPVAAGGNDGFGRSHSAPLEPRPGLGWSRVSTSIPTGPWRWGIGGGALCLVLLLALWLRPEVDAEPVELKADAATAAAQEKSLDAFERGVDLVNQRDWWGASLLFAEAAALDPANPEPAAYLERVGREAAFAERAGRARECFQRGDAGCAQREIDRIDRGSLVYEDLAEELLPAIARMEEVREEEQGDPEGGGWASASVAGDKATGPRGGNAGSRVSAAPSGESSDSTPAAARAGVPDNLPRKASSPQRSQTSPASASARQARTSLRGATSLQPIVGAEQGEEAAIVARPDPAEEAKRHIRAGVRSRSGGSLEKAAWHLEQALAAAPEDPLVKKELEELRALLPGLFREAYAARGSDPDGAAQKLRLVIRLSAPGSDLRAKAEKWLGRLEDQP